MMQPEDYVPINCEFHDVLESTATRRHAANIRFTDDAGTEHTVHARIADLITVDRVEYLVTDAGQRVRLDRLVSVDGVKLADFRVGD